MTAPSRAIELQLPPRRRDPVFQPVVLGTRRFLAAPLPGAAASAFRRDDAEPPQVVPPEAAEEGAGEEHGAAPSTLVREDAHRPGPEGGSAWVQAAAPPPPDLEAVRREAFERGVAEGRAALPWTDAEALRATVRAFTAAASELAAARRSYLLENRHVVVELACAIAERVLGAPPATDRAALTALVGRALELFPNDEPLALHLAPADRAIVEAGLAEEMARLGREGRVRVVEDATLAPGEARLLGRSSDVRASVAEVLERLRAELADAVALDLPASDGGAR